LFYFQYKSTTISPDERVSGNVFDDSGETSQERHSQNAHKQRVSENGNVSDFLFGGKDTYKDKSALFIGKESRIYPHLESH